MMIKELMLAYCQQPSLAANITFKDNDERQKMFYIVLNKHLFTKCLKE